MNKVRRRRAVASKRRSQESRRKGDGTRTYQGATPEDVLRNFLPEASSRELSRLRREPERGSWWSRFWERLLGRTSRG